MTELTDRMRTCAAYIDKAIDETTPSEVLLHVARDAMLLLEQGAAALEKPEPLGEPMPLLEPVPPPPTQLGPITGFTDPGPPAEMPTRIARSCPQCGSRAPKTVLLAVKKLECPVCGCKWPYIIGAKWV